MRLLKLLLVVVGCVAAVPAVAQSYVDANAAYFKGDYATALRHYRLLADADHTLAQVRLAFMYYEGRCAEGLRGGGGVVSQGR